MERNSSGGGLWTWSCGVPGVCVLFVQLCFHELHLLHNLVGVGGIAVLEAVEGFLYVLDIGGFELAHDTYFLSHLYALNIAFPPHGGVVVGIDDICVARREESVAAIVDWVFRPVHP